jgi:hypothetical protein
MLRQGFLTTALVLGLTSAASAVTLLPGQSVSDAIFDYTDTHLDGTEADFFGTSQATVSKTVTETRDGFIPPDVINNLYVVSASIEVEAIKSASGKQVFSYSLSSEAGFSPGVNGAIEYVISGFAGYDVDFGYLGDPTFPYAPIIERSANGNNITITLFDPRDVLAGQETLLFSTNAPTYSLGGAGMVDIVIDSFGNTGRMYLGLPAPAAIPLPAPVLALGTGLVALVGLRRRRRS